MAFFIKKNFVRRWTCLVVLIKMSCATLIAQVVAFPGAEGYGKFTTGGRGGKVYVVENLNDSGAGSLREAVEAKHPRMVVFAVSGTIHLQSPLRLEKNLTIAGQTAPGDGICIADQPTSLHGDNIIIRYIRFRMGDRHQNKGKVPGSGHDDALSGARRNNIIIDHCSLSWSTDEVLSIYDGDSTTLQWNIISEPLNYSYHFEKGDTDFENHGYGGIWGGRHLSAHHNLFIHNLSRNPRFAGIRTTQEENVDFVNNVIYNWGTNSIYGGEGGNYNIVNNYFKAGPNTNKNVRSRIVNPSVQVSPRIRPGKFYVNGNFVWDNMEVTRNNELGVNIDKKALEAEEKKVLQPKPIGRLSVPVSSSSEALKEVLRHAGTSFPCRDEVDQRLIKEFNKGTGKIIDVQGGYPHGTAYETSKTAWPQLKTLTAPMDTDKDGMPDEWEKTKGLNPNNAADAALFTLDQQYSNIEVYINGLLNESSDNSSKKNKAKRK